MSTQFVTPRPDRCRPSSHRCALAGTFRGSSAGATPPSGAPDGARYRASQDQNHRSRSPARSEHVAVRQRRFTVLGPSTGTTASSSARGCLATSRPRNVDPARARQASADVLWIADSALRPRRRLHELADSEIRRARTTGAARPARRTDDDRIARIGIDGTPRARGRHGQRRAAGAIFAIASAPGNARDLTPAGAGCGMRRGTPPDGSQKPPWNGVEVGYPAEAGMNRDRCDS